MAWAVSHPGVETSTASEGRTVTWPRGLGVIGFLLVVASAWAGIVPFIGPTFGYGADGTGAWDWTTSHALLHAFPGAVGVVCGLAVMGHAGGGRWAARLSLSFWGLAALATGAWMVVGPSAWPVFESGTVFRSTGTALDQFIRLVGYNLGVGGVILVFSGMILKGVTGEREVTLMPKQAATPAAVPVAATPASPAAMPVAADAPVTPSTGPARAPTYSPTARQEDTYVPPTRSTAADTSTSEDTATLPQGPPAES
jgi:hypothetical protein